MSMFGVEGVCLSVEWMVYYYVYMWSGARCMCMCGVESVPGMCMCEGEGVYVCVVHSPLHIKHIHLAPLHM
jgi:hypothetical protein